MKFVMLQDFNIFQMIHESIAGRSSHAGHLFVASDGLNPFSYKQIPFA